MLPYTSVSVAVLYLLTYKVPFRHGSSVCVSCASKVRRVRVRVRFG